MGLVKARELKAIDLRILVPSPPEAVAGLDEI